MKMTGDMVAHPRVLRTTGWECGRGKKGNHRRESAEWKGQPSRDLEGRVRWRHEMPWHRLPVCNGRESLYDLRSTTPPTSSVSQEKLSGSMVAIIRSRLVRIMTQRESDDALNMDFFFPAAKSWWEIRINCDWLLMSARSNQLVILMAISDVHLFLAVNLYLLIERRREWSRIWSCIIFFYKYIINRNTIFFK